MFFEKIDSRYHLSAIAVEKVFAIIGGIFGIIYLLLTPPFQVADEYNHYYRSFQISEGNYIAIKKDNFVGGELPKSLLITASEVSKEIPFHPENKQNINDIYRLVNLPLNIEDRSFIHFPNTALYSPIPYIPQALGIKIGININTSPIIIMYLGRFANLMFWLTVVYFAIKIMPDFKYLTLMIVLTPMSVFHAASLSSDAATNAISFLFIALVLESYYTKNPKLTKFILLIIIGILLSMSKQAYLLLGLLSCLLLLDNNRINSNYQVLLIIISTILPGFLWSFYIKELYIPFQEGISPGRQIEYIIHNPYDYCSILSNTFIKRSNRFVAEFIGRKLGWTDTSLPAWLITSYLLLLLYTAITDGKRWTLKNKEKLVLFIVAFINIVVIATFLYLSWTMVAADLIRGLRGRYFIPVALPLLLLFNNLLPFSQKKVPLVRLLLMIFLVVCHLTVSYTLYNRYW